MGGPDRWEVWDACPPADPADWGRHAAGFVAAFVVPAKRGRWLELLTRRPRRVGRNSHKLLGDLDRRLCASVGEEAPAGLTGDGLFFGFGDAPKVVPAGLAGVVAGGGDGLFSLVPGRLALYFFHEGEVWVCRARPGEGDA